jgi:hypothetical protein
MQANNTNAAHNGKAQKEKKADLEYETRKVPVNAIEDIVSTCQVLTSFLLRSLKNAFVCRF